MVAYSYDSKLFYLDDDDDRFDPEECLDGPQGCRGETFPRLDLSGSGFTYPRCDYHYEVYVARVQPVMDDINRRYPVMAPEDFDPSDAGETWDEDVWWGEREVL